MIGDKIAAKALGGDSCGLTHPRVTPKLRFQKWEMLSNMVSRECQSSLFTLFRLLDNLRHASQIAARISWSNLPCDEPRRSPRGLRSLLLAQCLHLLEFIKSNPALSIVPVVVLSCSDDADDIRQAYLLGASSFFVKPGGLGELKLLLRKIHDYWTECEVPEVDIDGYALTTSNIGRLGARYKKPRR